MVIMFAGSYFLAMLVIGIATMNGYLGYIGAVPVATLVCVWAWISKRNELRKRFTEQTLQLSPRGLVRADDQMRVEMAWSDIVELRDLDSAVNSQGFGVVGSGMAAVSNASRRNVTLSIVGAGTVSAVPGVSRMFLRAHDSQTGTNLSKGPVRSNQAVIFPAEYEQEWIAGVVGAWVRHYRPDLFR